MTKVLIVGGGIAGLSTAWALARRGVAVEVFEQGPLPNPKGSSYDEHRITRHAYGSMEGYAHLMPEAFRVWDSLWQAIGTSHYEPCGAVYFLRHETGWYQGASRSLDAMGIGYRDIPLGDVPARFPMVRPEGLIRVVETDGAGMLFPVRILTDLVVLLGRLGVRLHTGAHVSAVDPERGRVVANGVAHDGDTVVVAAGAWADRLVPGLRGVAVPSRQAVLYSVAARRPGSRLGKGAGDAGGARRGRALHAAAASGHAPEGGRPFVLAHRRPGRRPGGQRARSVTALAGRARHLPRL